MYAIPIYFEAFISHLRLPTLQECFHIWHTISSKAPMKFLKNFNFKKRQISSVAVISSVPHSAPSECILIPFLFALLQARAFFFLFFNRPAVVLTLYLHNQLQQSLRQLINIYMIRVRKGTIRLITFATKYETGFCKPDIFHIIKIQPAYSQCTNFNIIYSCGN